MVIEYKVIRQALNSETHDKIRNQVGKDLSKTIGKYENGIRENQKIDDVKGMISDIKSSLGRIIAKHVKLGKGSDAIDALTDSITDAVFQDVFGFNAGQAEKELEGLVISNYDDFVGNYIRGTRDAAVKNVQQYGFTGVQQHMQDTKLRPGFFEKSEKDLGRGFHWSDHARKTSQEYVHVADMLSAGIGKQMSQDIAKKSKKHVLYSP